MRGARTPARPPQTGAGGGKHRRERSDPQTGKRSAQAGGRRQAERAGRRPERPATSARRAETSPHRAKAWGAARRARWKPRAAGTARGDRPPQPAAQAPPPAPLTAAPAATAQPPARVHGTAQAQARRCPGRSMGEGWSRGDLNTTQGAQAQAGAVPAAQRIAGNVPAVGVREGRHHPTASVGGVGAGPALAGPVQGARRQHIGNRKTARRAIESSPPVSRGRAAAFSPPAALYAGLMHIPRASQQSHAPHTRY